MDMDTLRWLLYRWRRLWRGNRLTISVLIVAAVAVAVGWSGLGKKFWSVYSKRPDPLMDLIGGAALVLSFIAFVATEWIRRRISTRYIGEFPDHLDKITALVRTAAIRIDFLADCVDYGSFFRPKAHQKLLWEIKKAIQERGVHVTFIVCGPPQGISAASAWSRRTSESRFEDFGFRQDLSEYVAFVRGESQQFHTFIDKYLQSNGGEEDPINKRLRDRLAANDWQSTDGDVVDRLLLLRHEWFATKLLDGGDVLSNGERSDVFVWIIDGIEAVFLFAYPAADAMAFSTRDPGLIRVLKTMFNNKLNDSKRYVTVV
jgi:hypothetical protein